MTSLLLLGLAFTQNAKAQTTAQPEGCEYIGDNGKETIYNNSWGATDWSTGRAYIITVTDYYDWCTGSYGTTVTRVPV